MKRRQFLLSCANALLFLPAARGNAGYGEPVPSRGSAPLTLFLCGDVMSGRGIDQVLPRPSAPRLYESFVKDATRYVDLAQSANGPFPRRVDVSYPWGDALEELEHATPDVRIVNLETAITDSDDRWTGKGINYRMHPANTGLLAAAGIDCCVLANNHVLDWGYPGLEDTLESLQQADVKVAGAGSNAGEARAPAVLEVKGKGRVLVFAYASPTAGVPSEWAATTREPGVNYLTDLSRAAAERIAADVRDVRRDGDIVVVSVHWGRNWGYDIPAEQRRFARWLIDDAAVDAIHGHSSHHPKGIEIYRGKPILYGCGDFLNDYEGIGGYEEFRGDLALMYLVTMETSSLELLRLEMVPFEIKRFRLNYASRPDVRWLARVMDRECARLGSSVTRTDANRLVLTALSGRPVG